MAATHLLSALRATLENYQAELASVAKADAEWGLVADPLGQTLDSLSASHQALSELMQTAAALAKNTRKMLMTRKLRRQELRVFVLIFQHLGWHPLNAYRLPRLGLGIEVLLTRFLPHHRGPICGCFEAGQELLYLGADLAYASEVVVVSPAVGLRGRGLKVWPKGSRSLEEALSADVCVKVPASELHRQVSLGNVPNLEKLRALKGELWAEGRMIIDALDECGEIPLALALRSGDRKVISHLLDCGSSQGPKTLKAAEDNFLVVARMMSGRVLGNMGADDKSHGFLVTAKTTVGELRRMIDAALRGNDELKGVAKGQEAQLTIQGAVQREAQKPLGEILGLTALVSEVEAILSGQLLLAIGSFDATISVWTVRTGELLHKIDNHDANSLVLYPGLSKMVATVAEDCADAFRLEESAEGRSVERLHHFNLGAGAITTLLLDGAGKTLGAACEDGAVTLFDAETFLQKQRLDTGAPRGFGMTVAAMSLDGRWVAASGRGNVVWLWDRNEEPTPTARRLVPELEKVTCISFSPNARRVAVALRDFTVRICSVEKRTELCILRGHQGVMHGVCFCTNNTIATGSRDRTAKLWVEDDDGYGCVHTFTGHSGSVNAVAVSGDGAYLVTGSEDGTAKIWELCAEEKACLHTLKGHIAGISVVAFPPS